MHYFYFSRKARHFGDVEAARQIMATKRPMMHKRIGKEIKGYRAAEWDNLRVEVMEEALRIKFSFPRFHAKLMSTEPFELVEASPTDSYYIFRFLDSCISNLTRLSACRFWGAGKGKKALENDPSFDGQNVLGLLLMKIRDEFHRESATEESPERDSPPSPPPLEPETKKTRLSGEPENKKT